MVGNEDDELDAFFDEVEKDVQEKLQSKTSDVSVSESEEEPPSKKLRTAQGPTNTGIISSRMGRVVASSAPTKSSLLTTNSNISSIRETPASSASTGNASQHQNLSHIYNATDIPSLPPMPPQPSPSITQQKPKKPAIRTAAGEKWSDPTLADFPENDFRLFVGNLSKDITDVKLAEAFSSKYPSFAMARVCYNKVSKTSRGFGFVSLMDSKDCAKAIREMDQSWLGSRPIKVKLSEWKDRDLKEVNKKRRENAKEQKKNRW